MRKLVTHVVCALGMVLCGGYAVGQEVQSATVVGTVTDPTGAVVPNATVTVTNVDTNISARAMTNADGAYYVPFQAAGRYQITVTAPGFKQYVQRGVVLEIGQTPRINVTLEVGNAAESVEVTAAAPILATDNAVVGGTETTKEIHDTPMVQAKPQHLMYYMEGSQVNNDGTYHILGLPSNQINYTIDGSIVKQAPNAAIGEVNNSVTPPVDALMEAQVWTTGIPAELGHSAGGAYNMVTKSGTNELHFSAEERYINKDFLHRQIFNQAATNTPFEYHNFDTVLGGPIFIPKVYDGRNKTFFFLAFRFDYDHEQNTVTQSALTPAMLNGNFNYASAQPIYDPRTITCALAAGCPGTAGWTATQFPGNQIPVSRFDPVSAKFLAQNPYNLPNTSGAIQPTGPVNNLIANTHYLADKDGYLGRFDQQITGTNKAYFRFAWNRYRTNPGRENILYHWYDIDNTTNSYGEPEPIDTLNLTLGDVDTISPTVINEFRVSYQRRTDTRTPILLNQNWAGILGIPGVGPQTFPGFVNVSGSTVPWTANPGGRQRTLQDYFEYADNITKVIGLHTIKAGYQGLRLRENDITASQPSGVYNFGNTAYGSNFGGAGTGLPFTPNTGNSFASFLLGAVDNATFTTLLANYLPRWWSHQGFVQDDWRARSNLTISIGIRYSYETPTTTKYGFESQFNPNAVDPLTGMMGAITHPKAGVYKSDWNNFTPRLGVAYNFARKWVFRGSFGMFTVDNFTQLGQEEYLATAAVSQPVGNPYPAFYLSQGPGSVRYSLNSGGTANYVSLTNNFTGRNATYIDPNLRNPYTMSWSGGFQYQIKPNTIAEVVYQGSAGVALVNGSAVNINILPQSIYNSTDTTLLNTVYSNTQSYLRFPQFGTINEYSNWDHSTYNAMVARVEKRYASGLSFNFLYTWSKNLIGGPGSQVIGSSPTYTVGTGPEFYNWHLTKGLAPTDVTHQFVAQATYDIPVGKGRRWMDRGGIANIFLGGWTFLTIQSFRTGTPANFTMSGSPYRYLPSEVLPNIVSGQSINVPNYKIGNLWPQQTQNPFFNINAFAYPAAFTQGDEGIGMARYGGVWWPQYSLTKTIAYRERYKLTVRMDANNLFPETHAILAPNNVVNITSPQLFGKTPNQSYSFSNWYTPNGNLVGVLRIEF